MSSSRKPLALEVLGIDVALTCDDPDCRAVLGLCYARMTSARKPVAGVLTGSLRRSGSAWRVHVDGRTERTEQDATAAVRALNHEILQAVMRRALGLYHVHAAVVEWRGRAIVLPGVSRAGKSTLALAFLLEGASFLSDELLAWDPTSRLVRALPRAIKIRDECVGYFPELARRFRGQGEGRFLPFEALAPDLLVDGSRIGAVVVPRWSDAMPMRLERITRGMALLALAESSLNFGAHRSKSVDWLSALVEEARTFALSWREPREAAREVLRELEA